MKPALFITLVSMLLAFNTARADVFKVESPFTLLELAREIGSASLSQDSRGDPMITGEIEEGGRYRIIFYNCDEGKNCKDIIFRASWGSDRHTLQHMNEWNSTKIFGRAYLDYEEDPVLEMALTLRSGVNLANMREVFDRWQSVVKSFRQFLIDAE